MKRLIQSGLLIILFILGGCSTSMEEGENSKETTQLWPETRAFQDDFTREFMDSTEEVKDGYYRFKSKTAGYTMLFPKNAKVATAGYELNHDVFETYSFGEQVKEKNLAYYYKITFQDSLITKDIEFNLESLSEYAGYDGNYKKFEYEGKTYFYAKDIFTTNVRRHYGFFSYIKSNKSNKAIRYFVNSTCLNKDQSCEANSNEIEERFKMLMKSVDF